MKTRQAVVALMAGAALVASTGAFADGRYHGRGHGPHWAKHRTVHVVQHRVYRPHVVRHVTIQPDYPQTFVIERPVYVRPAPVYVQPAPVVRFGGDGAAVVLGAVVGGLVGYHLAH